MLQLQYILYSPPGMPFTLDEARQMHPDQPGQSTKIDKFESTFTLVYKKYIS
jgi:hypothetical protein